jgi:hypothetical protein
MTERERKRDPHQCGGCGARYDVAYFDDRRGSRAFGSSLIEVHCPACGKAHSVTLPMGAENTLLVELDEAESDEGGGG